jgi:hypothetical protein
MFLEAFARSAERVFATKIGEHPLQPAGFSAWTDAQSSSQRAQISFGRTAPNLFWDDDRAEDAPPT